MVAPAMIPLPSPSFVSTVGSLFVFRSPCLFLYLVIMCACVATDTPISPVQELAQAVKSDSERVDLPHGAMRSLQGC